nr:hypothetical protein [uncultured Cohaesibacter sp.]
MKQSSRSIPSLMTPIERELISSIEDWSVSIDGYIKLQTQQLEALSASLEAFLYGQNAFNEALIGWADNPNDADYQELLRTALLKLNLLQEASFTEELDGSE